MVAIFRSRKHDLNLVLDHVPQPLQTARANSVVSALSSRSSLRILDSGRRFVQISARTGFPRRLSFLSCSACQSGSSLGIGVIMVVDDMSHPVPMPAAATPPVPILRTLRRTDMAKSRTESEKPFRPLWHMPSFICPHASRDRYQVSLSSVTEMIHWL